MSEWLIAISFWMGIGMGHVVAHRIMSKRPLPAPNIFYLIIGVLFLSIIWPIYYYRGD